MSDCRRHQRGNGSDAATRTPLLAANANDILTPAEAAEYMRVSVRTLSDWRLNNTGPAYIKLGTGRSAHIRYLRRTLLGYMVANEQTTTSDAQASQ